MTLVDTSVWSLAFRRRRRQEQESPAARLLHRLILEDQPLALPGIVFQELLSGVRDSSHERKLFKLLEGFPLWLATREQHIEAARIFNACRAAGIAAATVDCLIAAQCVSTNSALLTTDADFIRIARCCPLELFPVAGA